MRYLLVDNFISPEMCKQLIELALPRLTPSESWKVEEGQSRVSDFRVSDQAWFQKGENTLIEAIEEKISRFTRTPVVNGEGLQVVRYKKGGYFKQHMDTFDAAYEKNQSVLARGGQRAVTCMIYLNTLDSKTEGGATYFPLVGYEGLRISPLQGRAFIWHNLDRNGKPDGTTAHSAEPVLVDYKEKWITTKWVREGPFI